MGQHDFEEYIRQLEPAAKDGNAYSPAWLTLNVRASYRFAGGLSLNATFENLTDRRYRPYSCGISAPGRNMTVSVTYNL